MVLYCSCPACASACLPVCLSAACLCVLYKACLHPWSTGRCADKGKLVEVRNHDWWGAPALGSLGPPAAALQGSTGHQPAQQQSRSVSCCWCKAEDHLVKDCPLNAYLDEAMGDDEEQEAHLAQHAGKPAYVACHLWCGRSTSCHLATLSEQCLRCNPSIA